MPCVCHHKVGLQINAKLGLHMRGTPPLVEILSLQLGIDATGKRRTGECPLYRRLSLSHGMHPLSELQLANEALLQPTHML